MYFQQEKVIQMFILLCVEVIINIFIATSFLKNYIHCNIIRLGKVIKRLVKKKNGREKQVMVFFFFCHLLMLSISSILIFF